MEAQAVKPRGHPRFAQTAKRQRPEHDEQQKIKLLLERAAIEVYDTSQPFQAFITPGCPDLRCFAWVPQATWPGVLVTALTLCEADGRGWVYVTFEIETKAPGAGRQSAGRQSAEQAVFERRWTASGHRYVLGGLPEVKAFLEAVGLARRTRTGEWALWAGGVRINRQERIGAAHD
jgi:hypothetical protein